MIGQDTELYPGYDRYEVENWFHVMYFNNYEYFGNIPRAMYTLFNVVIMAEWTEMGRAIIEYQPEMFIFFLVFIVFTTFGIMNVIIGVIVDNTMEAAKAVEKDQETFERRNRMQTLA